MDELYSIGELASRTGLTVKAIRFYSDRGLVPPTDRTAAGYRLYDGTAVARLDLIRTLRELGLDLATIRSILDHETALSDVAAAHAEALTVQIRTLRLRRAILTTVADRNSTPEDLTDMHRLAQLSATQRDALITDFLDAVLDHSFEGFAAARRSLTPELPDHPEPEQVEAWIELAELTQDADFRTFVRRMTDDYRAVVLRPDPPAVRRLAVLETANDPRWVRYLHLLAITNGWEPQPPPAPISDWTAQARLLHAR